MANNLITDSNTSIRTSAWHLGIEVVTAPVFIQFIFSPQLLESEEYIESPPFGKFISDPIYSDDFSYISFQV